MPISFSSLISLLVMRGAKGVKCMPMNRNISVMSEKQKEINETLRNLYKGLQPYCRFLTRNKWDGDDLAQESLVRAVQNYPVSQLHPSLLKKNCVSLLD